jgi:ATP synthase I chain
MTGPAQNPPSSVLGYRTERRILWLTPAFGLAAAVVALVVQQDRWAVGFLIGSGLAWQNFRSLKRSLDALVAAFEGQHGAEKPRIPLWAYALAVLRYGLLALAVYVIFVYLHVPLGSMIVGLCALGAAVIAASVWEILEPQD